MSNKRVPVNEGVNPDTKRAINNMYRDLESLGYNYEIGLYSNELMRRLDDCYNKVLRPYLNLADGNSKKYSEREVARFMPSFDDSKVDDVKRCMKEIEEIKSKVTPLLKDIDRVAGRGLFGEDEMNVFSEELNSALF